MTTHAVTTHHDDNLNPGWLWAAGIFQIVLGAAAVIWPFVFSVAIEVVIGFVMLVAGIAQVIASFMNKSWGGFFMTLLMGLLFAAAGAGLLWSPVLGVMTLTMFLAMVFLMQGIIAVVFAFQVRPEKGWGMALASAIASFFLAFIIFAGLRSGASAVILGLVFGINTIFAGVAVISIARTQKSNT